MSLSSSPSPWLISSSGKWQSNTRECLAACFVTSTTKLGVDTISGSSSADFCCPCSASSSKLGGMLLLALNVTVTFSPATFLESLASVPLSSSSHPPDILGRLLFFWIFFSSLISSNKKSLNALSPSACRPSHPHDTDGLSILELNSLGLEPEEEAP